MVPREVLMKTGLRPLNTARPVSTAHPKTTVYSARPMSHFSKSAQSTVKRPYQMRTSLTNKNFSQKVNTAKGKFYTARPKAVNTARPNSTVFNAVRANQISKNLMEDMLPLRKEPKEAKLLVKELLKLVLLKVPRKNNMYSVDIKNIVPKESLTCLVAKATLDELMLWNRRLDHVNFKTINKLVKDNLVRGLPSKRFENDQTYVACLKESNTKPYNRVLVVKPHNKTSYELFRGKTPALSFKRPFGCYVTILNTLYYLGKFDGKSDDGLFVGYSLNSKVFRVYNIRTRKVEESLHIRLENNTQDDNAGPSINTASTNVNIGSLDINTVNLTVTTAPTEATYDDLSGYETEADMSNITNTYPVSSTLNTRSH
nr:ribonuclease H-like domain-containing protein [Tanacetum cinerariifolium]